MHENNQIVQLKYRKKIVSFQTLAIYADSMIMYVELWGVSNDSWLNYLHSSFDGPWPNPCDTLVELLCILHPDIAGFYYNYN